MTKAGLGQSQQPGVLPGSPKWEAGPQAHESPAALTRPLAGAGSEVQCLGLELAPTWGVGCCRW